MNIDSDVIKSWFSVQWKPQIFLAPTMKLFDTVKFSLALTFQFGVLE